MLAQPARLALSLWIALVSACGSSAATLPPDAPQLPPDAGLAAITFSVRVPDKTPAGSSVYLAGDFQGWDPASPAYQLTQVDTLTYELTLHFPLGTDLAFKLTRGSWDTVEKGPNGEEIANHTFEVIDSTVLDVTVASWADISPHTLTGDVTTITIPDFLHGRRVWVYLPPHYRESTARYPVLYMLDGQNVFDKVTSFAGEWKVDESLEELIPAGEVQPIIVVAVDNAGSSRIDEYTPWAADGQGGDGAAHLDAIADELVPYVDATYRTLTGPTHTGLGGSSLGGLMALYATYVRRDVFGVNLSMSPSIWWDNDFVVTFASSSGRPAARVWMDMGTAEYDSAISDLERMRDAMLDQGFVLGADLETFEDEGAAHNEAAWSRRFPMAAKFLFPPN